MKYFTNQSLTEEISGDTLYLGIVDAGDSKKYSIWVLNDYGTLIKDLKFAITKIKIENGKKIVTSLPHPEIKITKAPEAMPIDDRQEIIFTWLPEVTLKEGLLVSLNMVGRELWG